jgi:hypothetical protein
MSKGHKSAGATGPRLQYVSANWINNAIFEPRGNGPEGQLQLQQATIVGKVLIAKRWYDLWLQLAGPIPLVWVESQIDGQRAWLTDMAKRKIDELLRSKSEASPANGEAPPNKEQQP